MEIGAVFFGLALLVLVAFIVVQPILDNRGERERAITPLDALHAQRDQVLDALRDLDFDHQMDKITDEDFSPQRAFLLAQGVDLLKQIDALAGAPGRVPARDPRDQDIEQAVAARRAGTPSASEAAIEAAIAARRAASRAASPAKGPACSGCGAPAKPGDRFCNACGATLTQPAACASCGTALKSGDRFCGKCGTPVLETAAAGAAQP